MAYSAYLEEHIQPALTQAVAAAALAQPDDTVEFVGQYLLKLVQHGGDISKTQDFFAQWSKDIKIQKAQKEADRLAMAQRQEELHQQEIIEQDFYSKLAEYPNKVEAMNEWVTYMEKKTKSCCVYISSLCQIKKPPKAENADEDEEEEADQDEEEANGDKVNALLYEAVSAQENQALLNTVLIRSSSKKSAVFDLFQLDQKDKSEEDAENEDGDEEEEQPEVEEADETAENEDGEANENAENAEVVPRNKVHIDMQIPNPDQDRLQHFTMPKFGSYVAFQACVNSYLNPEAVAAPLRDQWPRPLEEILAEQKAIEDAAAAEEEAAKAAAAAEAAAENEANENDETATEATEENAVAEPVDDAEAQPAADEEEAKPEEAAADADADDDGAEDGGDDAEDAENKEEEAVEDPVIPDPPQNTVQYAVSMDTLADEQIYNDDTLKFVEDNVGKLEAVLASIDLKQYFRQREFEETFKTKWQEYLESQKSGDTEEAEVGAEAEPEADKAEEEEEEEAEPEPESVQQFKKTKKIVIDTMALWLLLADHCMKPDALFGRILMAFVKLFDSQQDNEHKALQLVPRIGLETLQFDVTNDATWEHCTDALRNAITMEKVDEWDPTQCAGFQLDLIEKILLDINNEEMESAEGLAMLMKGLLDFSRAACELYKYDQEQNKQEVESVSGQEDDE